MLDLGCRYMVHFKACPRCKGDLQDNRDIYGGYFVCIQCGYYLTDFEETRLRYLTNFRSFTGSITTAERIESVITGTAEEARK